MSIYKKTSEPRAQSRLGWPIFQHIPTTTLFNTLLSLSASCIYIPPVHSHAGRRASWRFGSVSSTLKITSCKFMSPDESSRLHTLSGQEGRRWSCHLIVLHSSSDLLDVNATVDFSTLIDEPHSGSWTWVVFSELDPPHLHLRGRSGTIYT